MAAKRAELAVDAMSDAQLWRQLDRELTAAVDGCSAIYPVSVIRPYVARAARCARELHQRGQQLQVALDTAGRPSIARAVEDIAELLLWAGLEPDVADQAARRVLGIA